MRKNMAVIGLGMGLLSVTSNTGKTITTRTPPVTRKASTHAKKPPYFHKKLKPVPNGCEAYYFAQDGSVTTGKGYLNPHPTDVFYCIASSEKAAVKKYNKWLTNNKIR